MASVLQLILLAFSLLNFATFIFIIILVSGTLFIYNVCVCIYIHSIFLFITSKQPV